MDVHISNVPKQSTENNLRSFLKPHLINLSIKAVYCTKPRDKNFAFLTFLHVSDAEKFIQRHGSSTTGASNRSNQPLSPQRPPRKSPTFTLVFHGQRLFCKKSHNEANPYQLRVLAKEEKDRHTRSTSVAVSKPHLLPVIFRSLALSCGVWNYAKSSLFYEPQLNWSLPGSVKFGEHSMILRLDCGLRIDFLYFSTLCITTEEGHAPALIFSMKEPPRFYEKVAQSLTDLMSQLGLQNASSQPQSRKGGPERYRIPALDPRHEIVAGSCFVYRIALQPEQNPRGLKSDVTDRLHTLRIAHGLPRVIHRRTDVLMPRENFAAGLQKLQDALALDPSRFPFPLAFQILKLVQDAYLSPSTVCKLLPSIKEMTLRTPLAICVKVIRKMFNQIAFPGPESEASEFELAELLPWLKTLEAQCIAEDKAVEKDNRDSKNVAIIHRVKITPSAIRLCGPEAESNNRVLRKYPNNHEYFIRVQFSDEDGQQVRFNGKVSNEKIFHVRFKNILRSGIRIAGREYSFLGCSHSSLRSQSCWFIAPFVHEGSLLWDKIIIQELGNFSAIQSPAKCAARIGQVFSDTRTAVSIDPSTVFLGPEVERNGRVFSDGVGTMSVGMMEKIWDSLPTKRLLKPTLFQIRYQGLQLL